MRKKRMNYIPYPIERLFHGYASIRSLTVDKARKENRAIKVEWNNEYIVISPEDLDRGRINDEVFTSVHDGQKYRLIDFDWRSYGPKPSPTQMSLL